MSVARGDIGADVKPEVGRRDRRRDLLHRFGGPEIFVLVSGVADSAAPRGVPSPRPEIRSPRRERARRPGPANMDSRPSALRAITLRDDRLRSRRKRGFDRSPRRRGEYRRPAGMGQIHQGDGAIERSDEPTSGIDPDQGTGQPVGADRPNDRLRMDGHALVSAGELGPRRLEEGDLKA